MVAVERGNDKAVQVVHVVPQQSSVALHEGICGPPDMPRGPQWNPRTPLLLLPPGYQILDPENAPALMSELILVRPLKASLDCILLMIPCICMHALYSMCPACKTCMHCKMLPSRLCLIEIRVESKGIHMHAATPCNQGVKISRQWETLNLEVDG